jgi:hypothetical protein
VLEDSRSTAGGLAGGLPAHHLHDRAGRQSVLTMGVYAYVCFADGQDDVVSRTCQCVRNNLDGMEEARRVVDHMSKCWNGGDW